MGNIYTDLRVERVSNLELVLSLIIYFIIVALMFELGMVLYGEIGCLSLPRG